MGRAQSIWDIEVRPVPSAKHWTCGADEATAQIQATLRAGKPVGQAPPPMPVIPTEFEASAAMKPKRSKSMAARFRAGRRNPNNPMSDPADDDDLQRGPSSEGKGAVEAAPEMSALRYGDAEAAQVASGNVRFDQRRSPPRKDSIGAPRPVDSGPPPSRFAGSSTLTNTRSLGQEGQPESPQLGRRPSVMQRLFNKKSAKVRCSPACPDVLTAPGI